MHKPTYQFAGVELDSARRLLRSGEVYEEIPPLVFDALEFLASHPDQVVTKDELSASLWKDRVVTDASITQVIRKARAALEKCGADPGIIKTQHGHGYRLDAAVTVVKAESKSSAWQEHPFRTGAVVALLGGLLVTAANISDVLQWFVPDDSVEMLEQTQSTVESTDAKVDELVRLLRDQAAMSGTTLDPDSEDAIRAAVQSIVQSVDARKKTAVDQLVAGDVDAAAASIVAVAKDLDMASAQSVDAAAASWREAGAIYYTSNIGEAVRSFESAYRLRPDDVGIRLDLAYALIRAGRLDDAIAMFGELENPDLSAEIRADVLRGAGTAHKLKGEYDVAAAYLSRAMDVAGQTGLRRQALVLLQQGAIARARGDNALAREQFETAVGYAEEIGDDHLVAESLNNLGIIMASTGEFQQATAVLTRAYDIHVARYDLAGQATALGNLGATALIQDETEGAETYLLESVALGERLGWQRSIALDLINLGSISASREDFGVAEERLSRALDIALGAQLNEIHPIILVNLGELARDQGDAAEACRRWHEALPLLRAMQHNVANIVTRYRTELGCE